MAEAIDSVLSQAYQPLELIVVDDGSFDRSATVIKQYLPNLRYFYQPNRGIASARNTGVSQAIGSYLAFLDSDDVWMPGKLVKQLSVFSENPDMDAVFGHAEQFFSPEVDDEFRERIQLKKRIIPAYISPAMLIRREAYDRIGGYNEQQKIGLDMEWYARMLELKLNVMMLPEVVYRRRIHYSNINVGDPGAMSDRLHVLKMIIDRRRQES